jgi:hypothetical protein
MNIIFYLVLALVVLIIMLKLRKRGSACGFKCQLPKNLPPKTIKPYSEQLKEIREKIEKEKEKK